MNQGLLKEKSRELTKKQQSFLTELFKCGGNITKALELAGYKPSSRQHVLQSLKDEIIEQAKVELAAHSVTAINRVVEGMNDVVNTLGQSCDLRLHRHFLTGSVWANKKRLM